MGAFWVEFYHAEINIQGISILDNQPGALNMGVSRLNLQGDQDKFGLTGAGFSGIQLD
jgi:hypothetical protein